MTASEKAAGFPHSAIQGSMRVCRSPWLLAAYRGLPRLRVPRHPPRAFARLTTTTRSPSRARAFQIFLNFFFHRRNCRLVTIHFPRSHHFPLSNSVGVGAPTGG